MSDPLSIGASASKAGVRAAISRAAQKTGVDFNYLLAQAKLESSLDPAARARTSSAAGLYQFTGGTWIETLDRHGADHGMGWAGDAIEGGRVRDPGMRASIMGLRYDPDASSLMAAELANDNRAALISVLGREPDSAELYLAHFLGAGAASQFLTALGNAPGQSAAALLPKAAAANRGIFYDAAGSPRSVSGVMDLMRAKVSGAMEGGSLDAGSAWADAGPSDWNNPALAGLAAPQTLPVLPAAAPPPRPSMADTLRTTFALGSREGRSSAPTFVQAAYGRLRSFGL